MSEAPRLILLNGSPAVGKTSLAKRFAENHPLTLHLDVDHVRDMISGWPTDATGAGLNARAMVEAMAATYLATDHDVIVSQLYGRADGLASLEQVARRANATWVEIVLTARPEVIERRFLERGGPQLDAMAASDRSVADQLAELHDRLTAVIADRPQCIAIDTTAGDLSDTYRAIVMAIEDTQPSGT